MIGYWSVLETWPSTATEKLWQVHWASTWTVVQVVFQRLFRHLVSPQHRGPEKTMLKKTLRACHIFHTGFQLILHKISIWNYLFVYKLLEHINLFKSQFWINLEKHSNFCIKHKAKYRLRKRQIYIHKFIYKLYPEIHSEKNFIIQN